MSNNQSDGSCRTNSWLASAVLGILGFLLAWRWLEWGFVWSVIVGIIITFVLGYLLISMLCGKENSSSMAASSTAAPTAAPKSAPTPTPAPTPAPAPEAAAAPAAKKPAAKKPAAKKPAAAKPAAKKPAAKKPAPKPASDGKPVALKAARGGKADDLKKIKGIGPGLEKTLNENGIFHYNQIGAWKKAEIAYADEKMLKFKGRATRDEWVKQAKTLAKGGDTEFSKKVDKGGVY